MHYSQLLAISTFALLSTAIPTPADLTPRACTIQLPLDYQQLREANGSETYMHTNDFSVGQLDGNDNNTDTIVRFDRIPDGSYGCQLNVKFASTDGIASSGNTQVNVYTVAENVTSVDTYLTYHTYGEPSPVGSMWGTGTVGDATVVLNSQSCKGQLTFLVRIASDDKAGSVAFSDSSAPDASVLNGFFMTYNC